MRRLTFWAVAGGIACAVSVACGGAPAEPNTPVSEESKEPAEGDPFSCDDIEGLCEEPAEAAETPSASSARCSELDECQQSCTRGNAAACLEAFTLGRGVMSKAVGQELIERACTLGNAHACILSNDVDARDPRTGYNPPPR